MVCNLWLEGQQEMPMMQIQLLQISCLLDLVERAHDLGFACTCCCYSQLFTVCSTWNRYNTFQQCLARLVSFFEDCRRLLRFSAQ